MKESKRVRIMGMSICSANERYKGRRTAGIRLMTAAGGDTTVYAVKAERYVESRSKPVVRRNKTGEMHLSLIYSMVRSFYIANNRLLTHILFWMAYLLVYTGVHADGEDGLRVYFGDEVQRLPGALLTAYVNLYLLFPLFFAKKKYISYGVLAVMLLFLASLLNRVLSEWIFEPMFFPDTTHVDPIFVWYMLLKGMLWYLSPVLLLTLVIRIYQQSFRQEQVYQETVKEKLSAELNFLKAQVHPHFLFNTLNNLYALTLRSSPAAPRVVLKLSELMSYMLYDSQAVSTLLTKEIRHIENYIELEKIRYNNRLDVSLNVSGEVTHQRIAPLLLIPFVENAFKHGVSHETDSVWVTIDIKVKEGWLNVKVENSCTDGPLPDNRSEEKNGIGLQNVIKRLNLLYPDAHQLTLGKEPGRYIVDLKIKITG